MKKLIFATILMTITWSTFAQETILRKNAKGVLESVEFSAEDKEVTIPASAEIFLRGLLKTHYFSQPVISALILELTI